MDPLCPKPGSDDIDAVQRKHRNEQMAINPLAQLVPNQAQPEFGLERPKCGFQFSQSPVSTNRILNAPLHVTGAKDIMARSGIVCIKRRIALPGHGAGLAIRGLREGDVTGDDIDVVRQCVQIAMGKTIELLTDLRVIDDIAVMYQANLLTAELAFRNDLFGMDCRILGKAFEGFIDQTQLQNQLQTTYPLNDKKNLWS